MASLTLKNLPEPLLRDLRKAAAKDRRSLTQEVIHLLAAALGRPPEPGPRKPRPHEAQLAAWRKLAGKWESDADAETESEALQGSRTGGREVEL